MDLKPGLWQQQTLKLTMTQELSQAIALLQYSTLELTSFLENKALENPLLNVEMDNIKTVNHQFDRVRKTRLKVEKDQQSWIEQIGKSGMTIQEYLLAQMNYSRLDLEKSELLETLIEHIDENGYLCASIAEIAQELNISHERLEECLLFIQETAEPAGIGARNLKECLLIQLKRFKKRNEEAEQIISQHFEDFAEKKWKQLSRQTGIGLKEIQAIFDLVQTLNPRPGSGFVSEKSTYIIPDVVIKSDGDSFLVSIYDEMLPKISFNDNYYKQFSSHENKQVNRFLKDKLQDYQWILKSLEQRKETLKKVSLKIVEKQYEFFTKGPTYLKPMTMKEISDELDIHESTVSRAVREKYVQTPFGTYELRSFFTSTIQTVTSDATSSSNVKKAIENLISNENKQKPLSDQDIVHLLKEQEGMVISRRTVAKYREQMGIPSSSKRKRYD